MDLDKVTSVAMAVEWSGFRTLKLPKSFWVKRFLTYLGSWCLMTYSSCSYGCLQWRALALVNSVPTPLAQRKNRKGRGPEGSSGQCRDRSAIVSWVQKASLTELTHTHTHNKFRASLGVHFRLSRRNKANRQTMFLRSAEFLLWRKWNSSVTSGVENSELSEGVQSPSAVLIKGKSTPWPWKLISFRSVPQVLSLKLEHVLLRQEDSYPTRRLQISLFGMCLWPLLPSPGLYTGSCPYCNRKREGNFIFPAVPRDHEHSLQYKMSLTLGNSL